MMIWECGRCTPKRVVFNFFWGDSLILYGLGLYQRPLAPSNLRGGIDLMGGVDDVDLGGARG